MKRLITILLLGLAACGASVEAPLVDEVATVARDESPVGVAAVAKAIEARPADQARILAEHGWTAAELEAALFAIAEDPAKSRAYRAALGR